ncbi:MAG: hypothetical protein ACOC33_02210 [bacterium]
MNNIEEKFRKIHKILEEIKENYKVDLDNAAEFCEKYQVDIEIMEQIGFDLIVNRITITKLEKSINELYDIFEKTILSDDEKEDNYKNVNLKE